MERLQKLLAQAGITSRRRAEEMILAGRVQVNGHVVKELGAQADPEIDTVMVDNQPVAIEAKAYYVLNKPRGYISDRDDTAGNKTALDLVPDGRRLFSAGRLDLMSEGMLLLTNDGELANRLTHPRYEHEKEYLALVYGTPDEKAMDRLVRGVLYDGEWLRADSAERAGKNQPFGEAGRDETWLRLVLHEGKKRQIRHMCASLGHPVKRLIRVRMGPLVLGDLKLGEWRKLTKDEVADLRERAKGRAAAVGRGESSVKRGAGEGRTTKDPSRALGIGSGRTQEGEREASDERRGGGSRGGRYESRGKPQGARGATGGRYEARDKPQGGRGATGGTRGGAGDRRGAGTGGRYESRDKPQGGRGGTGGTRGGPVDRRGGATGGRYESRDKPQGARGGTGGRYESRDKPQGGRVGTGGRYESRDKPQGARGGTSGRYESRDKPQGGRGATGGTRGGPADRRGGATGGRYESRDKPQGGRGATGGTRGGASDRRGGATGGRYESRDKPQGGRGATGGKREGRADRRGGPTGGRSESRGGTRGGQGGAKGKGSGGRPKGNAGREDRGRK